MKYKGILIIILVLASMLRLYRIGEIPVSLFGDEIDAGYNAYSFLKTGRDYNGNLMPVHFESMGDYRPFGFIVSLVPSIAIFGLSDFSVRLVPALWGILGVWLIYLLIKKIINERVALLSAGILAIVPWHVHYSRFALEETMMTALLLGGVLFFYFSFKKSKWLIFSSFIFAYNAYTYNVAKLYSPLLMVTLIAIYRRVIWKFPKKYLFISVLVFGLTLFPLVYDSLWGVGQSRFNSINILNTPGMTEKINYARGQIVDFSPVLQRLFQNKAISALTVFSENYLNSFSPKFLFITGQADIPRHSLDGFGALYVWMFPFVLLGLYCVWKKRKEKFNQLLLIWLITAPIPAALTVNGGNHISRLFVMLPPLVIITALGIDYSFSFLKQTNFVSKILRWISIVGFLIVVTVSFIFYLERYYYHYSQTHWRSWQYGMKSAFEFTKKIENRYDQIIVTRSLVHLPMLYYLFYNKYDPKLLHEQFRLAKKGKVLPPTEQIGKYRFATINVGDIYKPKNTLYIGTPADVSEGWKQIGKLNSPDPMDSKPVLLFWDSK